MSRINYKPTTNVIVRYILILVTLITLSLLSANTASAVTLNYSIDTFKANNLDKIETINEQGVLNGFSTVYIPEPTLNVRKQAEVQNELIMNQIKIREGNIANIKYIYNTERLDWLYCSVESNKGENLEGWIPASDFYILPSRLNLNNSKPEEIDIYSFLSKMADGYTIKDKTSIGFTGEVSYKLGFVDNSISEQEKFENMLGINKTEIKKSGLFYDSVDKYQLILSIILTVIITILVVYVYTSIWGENSENSIACSTYTSTCILLTMTLIAILANRYKLVFTESISTMQLLILVTLIILGILVSGFVNIEMERVGRPLLYSLCTYLVVIATHMMIIISYNSLINPKFLEFLIPREYNSSTRQMELPITIQNGLEIYICFISILVLIAIYHRYSYSLSLIRQVEDTNKVNKMLEELRNEELDANDYVLEFKETHYRYPENLYRKQLPTLRYMTNKLMAAQR